MKKSLLSLLKIINAPKRNAMLEAGRKIVFIAGGAGKQCFLCFKNFFQGGVVVQQLVEFSFFQLMHHKMRHHFHIVVVIFYAVR